MKTLSELNLIQSHDEFEFMLIPTCNDYYIDNCIKYLEWRYEIIAKKRVYNFSLIA